MQSLDAKKVGAGEEVSFCLALLVAFMRFDVLLVKYERKTTTIFSPFFLPKEQRRASRARSLGLEHLSYHQSSLERGRGALLGVVAASQSRSTGGKRL